MDMKEEFQKRVSPRLHPPVITRRMSPRLHGALNGYVGHTNLNSVAVRRRNRCNHKDPVIRTSRSLEKQPTHLSTPNANAKRSNPDDDDDDVHDPFNGNVGNANLNSAPTLIRRSTGQQDVSDDSVFRRRLSPRLHPSTRLHDATTKSVKPDIVDVCTPICFKDNGNADLNSAARWSRCSKTQEDASKDSVIQRRLSPRTQEEKPTFPATRFHHQFRSATPKRSNPVDDFHAPICVTASNVNGNANLNSAHRGSCCSNGQKEISKDSVIQRRFSPRLQEKQPSNCATRLRDQCHTLTAKKIKTDDNDHAPTCGNIGSGNLNSAARCSRCHNGQEDSSTNSVILRRFSPRLQEKQPSNCATILHDQCHAVSAKRSKSDDDTCGNVGSDNLNSAARCSLCHNGQVDSSTNSVIQRRFSPRLQEKQPSNCTTRLHEQCHAVTVKRSKTDDDDHAPTCGNLKSAARCSRCHGQEEFSSNSVFQRRFSPRLHERQPSHPPKILHDHFYNGTVKRSKLDDDHANFGNVNLNIASRWSRCSNGQENASKDPVIQRRLSPRLQEMLPSHPDKRLHDQFHSATAKRSQPDDDDAHSPVCSLDTALVPHPSLLPNIYVYSANADSSNIHAMVDQTLRTFNIYCLQFHQEDEEQKQKEISEQNKGVFLLPQEDCNKRTTFQPDLKALNKMRKNEEILYHEKRIGHLPGIYVDYQFYSRSEMVAIGIHSDLLKEIDYISSSTKYKDKFQQYTLPIAVAVVMSGQCEDGEGNYEDIYYTGQGGNELVGSKKQKKQELVRRNQALKNSMEQSVPVRVIHRHENPSSYTGNIYSYDGLYKVVETLAHRECSGFLVYKFRLRRLLGQPKLNTKLSGFLNGCQTNSCGLPINKKKTPGLYGLVSHDMTNGQEVVRIPVINVYDDPPVGPAGFTYIKSVEVAETVKLPPVDTGCTCRGDCSESPSCACAKLNGSDFPYGDLDGGRLYNPKDIVFECGPNCGCGPKCLNRTSQMGIKYQLEVYRTPDKGWAVRTRDFISSGAPVCEYIGVLRKSGDLDNVAENDYIFEIDCLHTMNEIEGRERRGNSPVCFTNSFQKIDEEPEFSLDAGLRGNVARFINHSCEPNMFVQCVSSSYRDLRLARLVLFAGEDIPAMQELTYDYGYALNSVVGPDGKIKELACLCGSSECRGRLY